MAETISSYANLVFRGSTKLFSVTNTDSTNEGYAAGIQTLTTGEANLDKGGMTNNVGMVLIKNLDATNNATFGSSTGQRPVVVEPGECALFRVNATNVKAASSAGSVDVEYMMIEV